jgi:hypothetical protein
MDNRRFKIPSVDKLHFGTFDTPEKVIVTERYLSAFPRPRISNELYEECPSDVGYNKLKESNRSKKLKLNRLKEYISCISIKNQQNNPFYSIQPKNDLLASIEFYENKIEQERFYTKQLEKILENEKVSNVTEN